MADKPDITNVAELVIRRSSVMIVRVGVETARLPQFFIGANIIVMGQPAQIERMEALQSVIPGPGETSLELTLLML